MLHFEEMSVLERQRVMLERLYNQQKLAPYNNLIAGNMIQNFTNFDTFGTGHNCQEMARPSFSTVSNSSITIVSKEKDQSAIVASENVVSTKKRKAELYEEVDCKTSRPGEVQSEITEKSQRGASGNNSKENSNTSEVQTPDYIHVRARRGQATDSHSLAERARREKISKKMKYLQDLVPGCNKVTGKAGMLNEIINYVQSLQKQVEFLSMKLAALNPQFHLNTDNFFSKDLSNYICNFPTVALPTLSEYNIIQHQQGSTSVVTQMLHQRREHYLMPFQESSLGSSPTTVLQQQPTFEIDMHSLFQNQL